MIHTNVINKPQSFIHSAGFGSGIVRIINISQKNRFGRINNLCYIKMCKDKLADEKLLSIANTLADKIEKLEKRVTELAVEMHRHKVEHKTTRFL